MEKPGVTRNVIHIISRHSNWPAQGITKYFKQNHIYADKAGWARFIDIALLSLGAAFCLAGVVFFFAYNWADLHKFLKLGIVQLLIVVAIVLSVFTNWPPLVKNILLTAASILTGVLFAVFGQIYQTGADAYDFFLGWTVFITLWALASNFAPLWLIWLALVNTTFVLYIQQVGTTWPAMVTFLVMFLFNAAIIALVQLLIHSGKLKDVPKWFNKIVVLGAVACATISVLAGIFKRYPEGWALAVLIIAVVYSIAIYYSFKKRSLFYLCVIPLSVIIIVSTLIIETTKFNSSGVLLLISIFIIGSVTLLARQLINLKKHWDGIN
ncbi:MAG: DUF2157 domain-containing protein [Sphingobacteriales bacterium]|nr:MAG: DUF2157 domain-containing protein [Sphingobacteriales bacterium]